MARDEVEIHLWQASDETWRGRSGEPVVSGAESFIAGTASCRVHVAGIDTLYAELMPRGVVHPNGALAVKPWRSREFAVIDRDNNLITFFEPAA